MSRNLRVSIVQPAIPSYRLGLFDRMAEYFGGDFSVYASDTSELGILTTRRPDARWHRKLGPMRRILPGIDWQSGVLSIPLENLDVLVVSGAPRTFSTLALIAKAKSKGVRIIWWGHYWSATSRSWRAWIRVAIMRVSDAIVFYTDQEVEEYREHQGSRQNKSVYGLNNGIETTEIESLRAAYVVAKRPNDLLFIGRATPKAELGLLLDALCRPSCINVTLVVLGDSNCLGILKERAEILGISNRVTWHVATIDEKTIAAVANQCKAFIYPGAAGLSLIHGLAYGLPAIVHDNRWEQMPEIAAHQPSVNGVTFPQHDVVALAEVVAQLLSKPNKLEQMSAAAVSVTSDSFNTRDMFKRFIAVIEGLR